MRDSLKMTLLFYGLAILVISSFFIVALIWIGDIPIPVSTFKTTLWALSMMTLLLLSLVGCDRICGYFKAPKEKRGNFWYIANN